METSALEDAEISEAVEAAEAEACEAIKDTVTDIYLDHIGRARAANNRPLTKRLFEALTEARSGLEAAANQ